MTRIRYAQIGLGEIAFQGDRLRSLNPAAVKALVESMRECGQLQPILVKPRKDSGSYLTGYYLVAGRHRLEAARKLKWERIDAIVLEGLDLDQAKLSEIAENLHRADLTVIERSQHVAEWVRLTEEKEVPAQLGQKPKGGRPEGGLSAASREIGVKRQEAQRAIKIDGITPEAKEAAREAGLDDNQSALLKVANYTDKDQVEAVAAIAKEKAEKPKPLARPPSTRGLGRGLEAMKISAEMTTLYDKLLAKKSKPAYDCATPPNLPSASAPGLITGMRLIRDTAGVCERIMAEIDIDTFESGNQTEVVLRNLKNSLDDAIKSYRKLSNKLGERLQLERRRKGY